MDRTKYVSPIMMRIKKLDIAESFFLGDVELNEYHYKINIQGEWKEPLIKLPYTMQDGTKVLVRFSGKDKVVEDVLIYHGKSEWVEVDSRKILHYLADNQDQLDTIELIPLDER